MGARGPAPTPTRVLAMRGSWRANINREEPVPEPGIPDRPPWLDAYALECWDDLAPRLDAMGVLGIIDGYALALYCQTHSHYRKVTEFLNEHGDTYLMKDRAGNVTGVKEYPQSKKAVQLVNQLMQLGREFGLTPAARTRVRVIPPEAYALKEQTTTPKGLAKFQQKAREQAAKEAAEEEYFYGDG